MTIPSASMNLLLKNKFIRVTLITFGATLLYWVFGFYFIHLLPYQYWFKTVSQFYATSVLFFFALVILSNLYSVIAFVRAKWNNRKIPSIVAIGPAISLTILVLWGIKPYLPKPLPNGSYLQSFDSDIWIADDSTVQKSGITDRQKMLGDVVEHVLPGKSRNEIIRLLGLSSDDSNQETLNYYLGPTRGDLSGIHTEFLRVHFDTSAHYKDHSIFTRD